MTLFDASALICFASREPGHEVVAPYFADAAVSAVNWAETLQKITWLGLDAARKQAEFKAAGLQIIPFTGEDADLTAQLWLYAHHLSLADRCCLATAMRLGLPALTCEQAWGELDYPGKPEVILAR